MMMTTEDVIRGLIQVNAQTTDDRIFEGAMLLATIQLGKSEEEVSQLLYDGCPEEEEEGQIDQDYLWNLLRKHFGHTIEIAIYGDPDDPASVTLEDMDTCEVILDAALYTLCAREDADE